MKQQEILGFEEQMKDFGAELFTFETLSALFASSGVTERLLPPGKWTRTVSGSGKDTAMDDPIPVQAIKSDAIVSVSENLRAVLVSVWDRGAQGTRTWAVWERSGHNLVARALDTYVTESNTAGTMTLNSEKVRDGKLLPYKITIDDGRGSTLHPHHVKFLKQEFEAAEATHGYTAFFCDQEASGSISVLTAQEISDQDQVQIHVVGNWLFGQIRHFLQVKNSADLLDKLHITFGGEHPTAMRVHALVDFQHAVSEFKAIGLTHRERRRKNPARVHDVHARLKASAYDAAASVQSDPRRATLEDSNAVGYRAGNCQQTFPGKDEPSIHVFDDELPVVHRMVFEALKNAMLFSAPASDVLLTVDGKMVTIRNYVHPQVLCWPPVAVNISQRGLHIETADPQTFDDRLLLDQFGVGVFAFYCGIMVLNQHGGDRRSFEIGIARQGEEYIWTLETSS